MKKIIYFCFLAIVMFSCGEEDEPIEPVVSVNQNQFEGIEILFDEDSFEYAKSAELLQEINICSTEKQEELGIGMVIPDCSPKFFKLFPLKKDESLDKGFVLVTKSNTGGIALRRVLVFQRERGALVKTNGFICNLIGKRISKTGFDDLLLRFQDLEEGDMVFFNTIWKWNGDRYEFSTVENIDVPASDYYSRVIESKKDSVSKEILKTITENNMIF